MKADYTRAQKSFKEKDYFLAKSYLEKVIEKFGEIPEKAPAATILLLLLTAIANRVLAPAQSRITEI